MKTTQNTYCKRIIRASRSRLKCGGVSLGMVCIIAVGATPQTNGTGLGTIPNGSFETEVVKEGKSIPEGWGFFPTTDAFKGEMVLGDKSRTYSGENAVSITGDETAPLDTSAMWLTSDPIKVTPGTTYSLAGWIKTANCNGKGAWLWINAYEKIVIEDGEEVGGEITSTTPYIYFTGTEDWQEWSAQFQIKQGTRWLRIACRLDGPGTATFDDIKLSKE